MRVADHRVLGKTQTSIDTWSYNRGVAQGYIPSDISNASTLAYSIMANGCVNPNSNYTAPLYVSAAERTFLASATWTGSMGLMGVMVWSYAGL